MPVCQNYQDKSSDIIVFVFASSRKSTQPTTKLLPGLNGSIKKGEGFFTKLLYRVFARERELELNCRQVFVL